MAKFTLALAVCVASLSAAHAGVMAKPLGKWQRKSGKNHVTIVVEENRLHVTFTGDNPCVLHADYALTKDGVIYGVVTSIECEDDQAAIKTLFDAPFSCRYRLDEGALIVHDLKCHETSGQESTWSGSFQAVASPPRTAFVLPYTTPTFAPVSFGFFWQPKRSKDNAAPPSSSLPTSHADFIKRYYQRAWDIEDPLTLRHPQ